MREKLIILFFEFRCSKFRCLCENAGRCLAVRRFAVVRKPEKKHFESAHTWRVIASSGPLPCWSNRMFDISWHWAYAAYLALILWYFLELSAIYSTLRPRQTLYRLPRNAFMHTMPIERRRSAGLSDSSWEWNLKERENGVVHFRLIHNS